ncbi:ABC transporter G family member 35 [Cryptomeria japonica]|uniref:ABC transporter G family member 35 n=1 Tax=Cryptomeria japonica TaxID=3369 RepID=UPI0027DA34FF|nr:ABC transporter G family member 35 [Cryptomeria japonica]
MAHRLSTDDIESFREELAEVGRSMRLISSNRLSFRSKRHSSIFSQASSSRFNEGEDAIDDEEALHWAAIERLPTYDKIRASILKDYDEDGIVTNRHIVDVRHLKPLQRHLLIEKLIKDIEKDNEKLLKKLRKRIDKVGIEMPTVEVRYQNLTVDANCLIGSRALPTLWNVVRNSFEVILDSVHLSPSEKVKFTILKDVSGVLKPSRFTLLLGPPGCGKTTLLQALSGKLDPKLKMKGHISYNGFKFNEFVPRKTSAYISQYDLHIPEMTVRETFDFSARCQGVGSRHELLLELGKREKEAGILPEADIDTYMKAVSIEGLAGNLQTDYILKILGLDICSDIKIGNAMVRGISGGQRKRVTTGEMIVSPMKTLFMDDISSGLDSSTTFQIVKCLQHFAHIMKATILISLLQPAPETFSLFDDIILMSEGQIVYHGPRDHALEFFENCGFKCPERKDTADFLQEVTSRKDQEQYWYNREKPYVYFTVGQFSQRFKQFHVGQALSKELLKPYDKSKSHKDALSFSKYSHTKWELFKICFDREWLLMKRNSFIYIFKAAQLLVIAFIAMTVFLRTNMKVDLEHGNYYLGALFFSLIFLMFNGFAELTMTLVRLPIFYKQRDLFFFPAWAYTLPGFVLKIPLALMESFIWTSTTYYVIGYSPEASRFFRQFLVFFALHQMASSLFRAIAGLCRTVAIANTGGAFTILSVLTVGGFLIPRPSIPKWCRWAYWISPFSYAETAITVNEFLAPRWEKLSFQNTSLGVHILENRALFHEDKFYWIGIGSLIGFTLLFNFAYTIALTYLNPIVQSQTVISREEAFDESKRFHQGSDSARFIDAKRGMILPFQPLSIVFKDIQYFVDMPVEMKQEGVTEERLQLLRDVTGAFRPAVLTALMGVSGAGKTTLMDVLAGRKTGGYIEGDIRISGFPKVQETFARISGYCEQNDIHSPQVTVHESLLYSAWLRLAPEIDSETKKHFVQEVMQLVELDDLQDALVGVPGVTGLSTEQRKRLTIAVELVANPSIIFMDEPTSGLDARAAAIVMRAVRNTVDTGRTVVCTIHQPNTGIFESFDELLLMKRGGEIIYAGALGHHSKNVIDYFEAIAGVPKIRDKYNPATWMLEVTSVAVEQQLGIDFAQIYRESSLCRENIQLVQELSTPVSDAKDLCFSTQYAQNTRKQFTSCLWKQFWAYWRSPGYNLVRFSITFASALLFGTIYWQQGAKIDTEGDLLKMMGAMYAANVYLGVTNCSSVQPVVDVERQVFYRERAAGMYSGSVYAWAQVVVEFPYALLQAIIYGLITYSMMGYHWSADKFFWYIFASFCTFLYFTYYGMLAVSISPNAQVAAILASAFYSIFNLFAGFLIPQPQIPGWWVWYYWICPTSWTLNCLITSQYGDMTKQIRINDNSQQSIKGFVKDYFGFHHDMLGVVAAVLVIFPVFFATLFAISLTKTNFQKR